MKHLITALFSIVALITVPAPALKAEDIPIGWIGPLTGNAAVLGIDALEAVQMAFEEANKKGLPDGRRLRLIAEDDQYLTSAAVNAYNKLVRANHVKVIIIYTYSALFALAPMAEHDGVLLLDPLDCDEDIAKLPEHVICVAKLTEDFGRVIAQDIASSHKTPVAVLYFGSDAFPLKTATATRDSLKAFGIEPVVFESYLAGTDDFKPLLSKVQKQNPASLAIFGYDEVGIAFKQIKALGIKSQLYGLFSTLSPEVRKIAGETLEGARFSSWKASRGNKFNSFMRDFKARTKREPALEVSTIPSYDVATILVQAITNSLKVSDDCSMPGIIKYFYGVKDYQGVSGKITIDPDGITRSLTVGIQQIKNGQAVELER